MPRRQVSRKNVEERVALSVRVTPAERAAIETAAANDDRSVAYWLRAVVREKLARDAKEAE